MPLRPQPAVLSTSTRSHAGTGSVEIANDRPRLCFEQLSVWRTQAQPGNGRELG